MNSYKDATDRFNEFMDLIEKELTEESCKRMVELIDALKEDGETAHIMEKKMWEAVLKAIDHPLTKLALLTGDIEFSRWFA